MSRSAVQSVGEGLRPPQRVCGAPGRGARRAQRGGFAREICCDSAGAGHEPGFVGGASAWVEV